MFSVHVKSGCFLSVVYFSPKKIISVASNTMFNYMSVYLFIFSSLAVLFESFGRNADFSGFNCSLITFVAGHFVDVFFVCFCFAVVVVIIVCFDRLVR